MKWQDMVSLSQRFSTCGPRTTGGHVLGGPQARPKILTDFKEKIWKKKNFKNFRNFSCE